MIYYFYNSEGDQQSFYNIDECRNEAIRTNQAKFRDAEGGEYFI